MKGLGMLWHPLSTLAGPIEAFGALLQLPALLGLFQSRSGNAAAVKLSVLGCYFCTAGLGVIVSTYKRKVIAPTWWNRRGGPKCTAWHSALTCLLLFFVLRTFFFPVPSVLVSGGLGAPLPRRLQARGRREAARRGDRVRQRLALAGHLEAFGWRRRGLGRRGRSGGVACGAARGSRRRHAPLPRCPRGARHCRPASLARVCATVAGKRVAIDHRESNYL